MKSSFGPSIEWDDKGFQITVLTCPVCGKQFRFNNSDSGIGNGVELTASQYWAAYDAWATEITIETAKQHVCHASTH